mmetsp:Transcript_15473/g.27444  ORF Transcript_15473/g.27444 Transcript_15473/m.27444 type:complete len:554 (+) Transcript_15473:96-1757(+)
MNRLLAAAVLLSLAIGVAAAHDAGVRSQATNLRHSSHEPDQLAKRHCVGSCQRASTNSRMHKTMQVKTKKRAECKAKGLCPLSRPPSSKVPCVNGMAGEYPCHNVDMLALVPLSAMANSSMANDIWGWTDPDTGHEYAIVGLAEGTAFVDVSDPTNPVVVGIMPTHTLDSIWRDVKVYKDHACVVSEAKGHGMQIFDLRRLRLLQGLPEEAPGPLPSGACSQHSRCVGLAGDCCPSPDGVRLDCCEASANSSSSATTTPAASTPTSTLQTFLPDAFYDEVTSSHNIAINEQTGIAYLLGTQTCSGGLHMVNITSPTDPHFLGCFDEDGYTHDAQCVVYRGPDKRYTGGEICFSFNEDTVTVVDVTNKLKSGKMLARVGYNNSAYTHQGWLDDKQEYLFVNDELDEMKHTDDNPSGPSNHTRTMVWDVRNLHEPTLIDSFYSIETAIDHNLYVDGQVIFETNYCAGLRVLEIAQPANGAAPTLVEVGFFDASPDCSTPVFEGTWSNYPYFKSGIVVVSHMELGLLVLKPNFPGPLQHLSASRSAAYEERNRTGR